MYANQMKVHLFLFTICKFPVFMLIFLLQWILQQNLHNTDNKEGK